MNRMLAMLLLIMMVVGLLFSLFALSQGKFVEALLVYPLLVVVWVFTRIGSKGA